MRPRDRGVSRVSGTTRCAERAWDVRLYAVAPAGRRLEAPSHHSKENPTARNLVRFDPFAELTALQKQIFPDGMFASPRVAAFPTTDVYTEDDKKLTVETHLPNFADDDISVNIDQGALVIQAEKQSK